MPGIFVALFWIWTSVSVVILLHRLITTGTVRPGGTRRGAAPVEATEPRDRIAEFEARLAAETPEPGTASQTTDTISPAGAAAAPPTPSDRAPDPGAANIARAESLAEALTGIEMPADLSPLVGDTLDPRRMLFSTGTSSPEAVGAALGDELERLGFELRMLDERSVAARRPGAALEVRILPSGEAARSALGDRIEAMPENTVITEFQLR